MPFTFVFTRTRLLSAVMYSVLPSSPKPQLAVGTPVASVPRCLPSGREHVHAARPGREDRPVLAHLQPVRQARLPRP